LGYALSTTAIASAFYLFVGSSPYLVVDQLQGDSADFGLWFLAVSLAFMLGSFSSTQLARHFSIDQMVLLGNGLSLVGTLVLLLAALFGALSFATLFLPMALVTFGRGLSQPNAQSAAISCASGSAGTASGLRGFIQLLTGAAIAQLVPWLLELGITTLFSCMLLAPCVALLAHWHAWRAGRQTTDSASAPGH
jgi:DHA1 family bicyclomycin/chloramphenicol resistance-like MFS transporter